MTKVKLKSGDMVKVIAGKHRGTIDYISRLDLKKKLVYLKKANKKNMISLLPKTKRRVN